MRPLLCTDCGEQAAAGLRLGDIFRVAGAEYARTHRLDARQHRALVDIARCRTEALGGYRERCEGCGYEAMRYHGCRNRHCPSCQGRERYRWIEARLERWLPTHAFHVVLTLPSELRGLALANPRELYSLLFATGSKSLLELAADPQWLGGQVALTAVLHTWTRELELHPHLHCIVSGGGLSEDGERWVASGAEFLFPVRVLGALFRGKFLEGLRRLSASGSLRLPPELSHKVAWDDWVDRLYGMSWVAYTKRPFDGVKPVIEYLGQYTHRVGLSNRRLVSFDGQEVTFVTRKGQTATLDAQTFIRRFLSHVLPRGFTRIRHYGLYAPVNVGKRLVMAHARLEGRIAKEERQDTPGGPESTGSGALAERAPDERVLERRCPRCQGFLKQEALEPVISLLSRTLPEEVSRSPP